MKTTQDLLTDNFSVLASTKSSPALILLPTVSLVTGVFSTSANMQHQLIVAVLSITFSAMLPNTVWTNLLPRSSRNASRSEVLSSLSVISSVSAKGARIVLAFPWLTVCAPFRSKLF